MSTKQGITSRRKRETHKTPRKGKPEAPIAVCGHGTVGGKQKRRYGCGRGIMENLKPGHVHKVRGRGLITSSDRA